MKQDEPLSFNHIKIRQIRENNKLSQAALAEKLRISQSAYNDLEQGRTKMKADMLPALAYILNVEIHCFFEGRTDAISNQTSQAKDKRQVNIGNYSVPIKAVETGFSLDKDELYEVYRQKSEELLTIMRKRLRSKKVFIVILLLSNSAITYILILLLFRNSS